MHTLAAGRGGLLALAVGMLLACGGLDFGAGSLEKATWEEATAAGYRLPEGAREVYAVDFADPDRRSTYLRFGLDRAAFDELREHYRSSDDHLEQSSWSIPAGWPDFGASAVPGAWWDPSGQAVFHSRPRIPHPDGGFSLEAASMHAFDEATLTVFTWSWQWERWHLPDPRVEPLVVRLPEVSTVSWVELQCETGFRQRARVQGGEAVFPSAPEDDPCTLMHGEHTVELLPRARRIRCRLEVDTLSCTSF